MFERIGEIIPEGEWLNELALFVGGGGGLLGGSLVGFETVCAVEIEESRREYLLRRQADGVLPMFPIWDDVRTFDGKPWRGRIDVLSAGFPCQPFSVAGKRAGHLDERNGWPDTIRIIKEVGPTWCFLENVPNLLNAESILHGCGWEGPIIRAQLRRNPRAPCPSCGRPLGDGSGDVRRYFGTIQRQLAEAGYCSTWDVISAADLGASHLRERLWIVAHADDAGREERRGPVSVGAELGPAQRRGEAVGDTVARRRTRLARRRARPEPSHRPLESEAGGRALADTEGRGLPEQRRAPRTDETGHADERGASEAPLVNADGSGRAGERARRTSAEPDQERAPHGLSEPRGEDVADAHGGRRSGRANDEQGQGFPDEPQCGGARSEMADANDERLQASGPAARPEHGEREGAGGANEVADADDGAGGLPARSRDEGQGTPDAERGGEAEPGSVAEFIRRLWPAGPTEPQHDWEPPRLIEPGLGGGADGVADRVDRIATLGDGQVPIVAAVAFVVLALRLIDTMRGGE